MANECAGPVRVPHEAKARFPQLGVEVLAPVGEDPDCFV